MCGELSSYSDACSNIVLMYQNEIYSAVKNGFNKRDICMLSGMCSEAFHPHADGYEVRIWLINNHEKDFTDKILICRNLGML